ncbi:universal stress protein [Limibacillus halophilus]|jgi:nucleotide-binding universal stress UspA family protein
MSLKTILVHLANDEEHVTRLKVALKLAREQNAKVFAIFIANPVGMPPAIAGRGASSAYIAEATRAARERAQELEAEFASACSRDGVDFSWLVIEGDHVDVLSEHAHAADIIIASQPVVEHLEDRFRVRLQEELVMKSGLPVLIIPKGFDPDKDIGKHILVGWKGTREAVRAVRDALPMLQAAEKVIVLTVGADTGDALSKLEVMGHLRRHGIEAKTENIQHLDEGTGPTITDFAEAHGCDLIVLGAYGHSRWREVFMGGVTKHMLMKSKVPVMLSH